MDDPTIEGLWTAREFDDLGNTTFRQPLIVRGQSAKRSIRTDAFGQSWFPRCVPEGSVGEPNTDFSGLLVGRGESTLQEILTSQSRSVLVTKWEVERSPDDPLGFKATVDQAVIMDGDTAVGVVAPNSLNVSGTLFEERNGLFSNALLSRELQDTGSAVAPFVCSGLGN